MRPDLGREKSERGEGVRHRIFPRGSYMKMKTNLKGEPKRRQAILRKKKTDVRDVLPGARPNKKRRGRNIRNGVTLGRACRGSSRLSKVGGEKNGGKSCRLM